MPYKLKSKDLPKAVDVMLSAFSNDPVWDRVFEGIPDMERKRRSFFEIPVKFCHEFGEVFAPSEQIDGAAAWVPGHLSDMTIWRMLKSGALLSGLLLGPRLIVKMERVFKQLQRDRLLNMKGKRFIYLFMIGVMEGMQGKGLGGEMLRVLIERAEQIDAHLYLETETAENVQLYQRFGFDVIRRVNLPIINQPMWEMVRQK